MNIAIITAISLVGSLINIPLLRTRSRESILSVNVGGAVVPIVLSIFLIPWIVWESFVVVLVATTFFSFMGARVVENRGIMVAVFLPTFFATFFALLITSEHAVAAAFSAGSMSVLVGADILNMPSVLFRRGAITVIGGKGVFDAIFLTGLLSAVVTSFFV